MEKSKKDILGAYMMSGVTPILVEDVSISTFKNPVILEADCNISLLNGHYEKEEFVAPSWYNELVKKDKPILLINEINSVSKEEQAKFIEILKYNKVSTFELPKNCIVIATCKNLKEYPINQEAYSLMAHV